MASIDWPLEQLVEYRPELTKQDDFDAFWDAQLAASAAIPLNAQFTRLDDGLPGAQTCDVSFDRADGVRVRGWFMAPLNQMEPLSTVVQFIGYTGDAIIPRTWRPTCST